MCAVGDGHDFAVVGEGGDGEAVGKGGGNGGEGVVAGDGEGFGESVEEGAGGGAADVGGLSVHEGLGVGDGGAEGGADGLVAEAYAEDRDARAELLHGRDADACVFGATGAGREDEGFGGEHRDAGGVEVVVADDADVGVDGADELVEVVGEGVVVVDDQDHGSSSFAASSMARTTAAALLTVSSYSGPGWESATMPPPLRT